MNEWKEDKDLVLTQFIFAVGRKEGGIESDER